MSAVDRMHAQIPDEAVKAFVDAAWVPGRGIGPGPKIAAGLAAAAPYLNRGAVEAMYQIAEQAGLIDCDYDLIARLLEEHGDGRERIGGKSP